MDTNTTPTQPLTSPSRPETGASRAITLKPSTSTDSLPKRKRRALRDGEKFMVSTVYKQIYKKMLAEEKEDMPFMMDVRVNKNECVLRTAELLGISRTTIFKVLKEEKEYATFNPPMKPGPKTGFRKKLKSTFSAIRLKLDELYRLNGNELPTMAKVCQAVNDDKDLPNVSVSTMRRILKNFNFEIKGRPCRSKLKQDINQRISPQCGETVKSCNETEEDFLAECESFKLSKPVQL